jgi:hypothetical protein
MLHQLKNSMEIGMVHPHATYVSPLPLSIAKKGKKPIKIISYLKCLINKLQKLSNSNVTHKTTKF